MAGKTLVVIRNQGNFEFFFENEEDRYWRVQDHPDFPGWFLVDEFEHGWYVGSFSDEYENAGVEDLQGLYEALISDPVRTLEGLFGERFEIKEVKVEGGGE